MKQKDYAILLDCLETRKRNDGTEFICKKDSTPASIAQLVDSVMFENDNHDFDLNYGIMLDALNFLADNAPKLAELKKLDIYDHNAEYASVYTATRLSYLNVWTEDEISDTLKEYNCDIQTACAIWYDNQVNSIINQLKDKILSPTEFERFNVLTVKKN